MYPVDEFLCAGQCTSPGFSCACFIALCAFVLLFQSQCLFNASCSHVFVCVCISDTVLQPKVKKSKVVTVAKKSDLAKKEVSLRV